MRIFPALVIFGGTAAGYVYQHPQLGKEGLLSSWMTTEDAMDGGPTTNHVDGPAPAGSAGSDFASAGGPENLDLGDPVLGAPAPRAASKSAPAGGVEQAPLDFSEVFRFDLTPQAIAQRWLQVSKKSGEANLRDYRVAVVTGRQETDLAGSLTYSFDRHAQMRRIAFLGTTNDPRRIIEFVSQRFGFKAVRPGSPRPIFSFSRKEYRGRIQVDRIEPAETADLSGEPAGNAYLVTLTVDHVH